MSYIPYSSTDTRENFLKKAEAVIAKGKVDVARIKKLAETEALKAKQKHIHLKKGDPKFLAALKSYEGKVRGAASPHSTSQSHINAAKSEMAKAVAQLSSHVTTVQREADAIAYTIKTAYSTYASRLEATLTPLQSAVSSLRSAPEHSWTTPRDAVLSRGNAFGSMRSTVKSYGLAI